MWLATRWKKEKFDCSQLSLIEGEPAAGGKSPVQSIMSSEERHASYVTSLGAEHTLCEMSDTLAPYLPRPNVCLKEEFSRTFQVPCRWSRRHQLTLSLFNWAEWISWAFKQLQRDVLTGVVSAMLSSDITFFVPDNNPGSLQNKLNTDLASVHSWCVRNKLIINLSKTTFMLFHSSKNLLIQPIAVSLNNDVISRSTTTKFRGAVLDENLKFHYHTQSLIQKISFGIHIIIKTRYFFHLDILMSLYYAYIDSHLSYCLSSWSNTYYTHHHLKILQKQALRLVTFQNRTSPSAPIFRCKNVLPLRMLFHQKVSLLMFRLINTDLNIPGFTRSSFINNNNTRFSGRLNLLLPKIWTSYRQFTVAFLGISIWNSLPSNIKSSSLFSFKRKTKEHFVRHVEFTTFCLPYYLTICSWHFQVSLLLILILVHMCSCLCHYSLFEIIVISFIWLC